MLNDTNNYYLHLNDLGRLKFHEPSSIVGTQVAIGFLLGVDILFFLARHWLVQGVTSHIRLDKNRFYRRGSEADPKGATLRWHPPLEHRAQLTLLLAFTALSLADLLWGHLLAISFLLFSSLGPQFLRISSFSWLHRVRLKWHLNLRKLDYFPFL